MGQSLVKNYVHIVFSTKDREPLIYPPYEGELYTYLAGACQELRCPALKVGGYKDHVHMLCLLKQTLPLMTLVQKVKANSSKWMKAKSEHLHHFYWQDGYGAFSVSPREVDVVKDYIVNQHIHHRHQTFKEEYRKFLKKYNVEYDERYVWD